MKEPKSEAPDRAGLSRRRFFGSVATGAAEAAIVTTLPAAAQAPPGPSAEDGLMPAVFNVNGQTHSLRVEPRWTLLYVLRDRLGFTGTKPGCERGECGACTVLIDGVARYSCLTLALEAAGTRDHHRRRADARRANWAPCSRPSWKKTRSSAGSARRARS